VKEKKQDDLVRRFVKDSKRKGATVDSHRWFASAEFKNGRHAEIFAPEKKRKRG
jgi:hypothetical protein